MPAALEFWPSLGAYEIYDDLLYGLMNAEPVRLAAYRAAFAASVPGKVVLDIGTGSDAVLARLCVEAGARHVYAVEVLEAAARQAAELVRTPGSRRAHHGPARRYRQPGPAGTGRGLYAGHHRQHRQR